MESSRQKKKSLGRPGAFPSFNLCIYTWKPGKQAQLCLGQTVTWVILCPLSLCGQGKSAFHRGMQDPDSSAGNVSTLFRFLMAQSIKNLPAVQETQETCAGSLG